MIPLQALGILAEVNENYTFIRTKSCIKTPTYAHIVFSLFPVVKLIRLKPTNIAGFYKKDFK